ncbi:MAG: DUF4124 domain-containing protein [Betaproteobacteria bacterium]|nr:DUF4124 domain-containing protein [Betaproteobacteria bacterium]
MSVLANPSFHRLCAKSRAAWWIQTIAIVLMLIVIGSRAAFPSEQFEHGQRTVELTTAYERLSAILTELRAGRAPSAADQQIVMTEMNAIAAMPSQPYHEAYLRMHVEYLRYLAVTPAVAVSNSRSIFRCVGSSGEISFSERPCTPGSTQTSITLPTQTEQARLPGESCETARQQLADTRRAHDNAVEELAAGAGDNWRVIEARRVTAVYDLHWYTDRLHTLGCGER